MRIVRHIYPVRVSGSLPAYDRPHVKEDIKIVCLNTSFGYHFHHCSSDVDEIMRRLPGIRTKELEFIVK